MEDEEIIHSQPPGTAIPISEGVNIFKFSMKVCGGC